VKILFKFHLIACNAAKLVTLDQIAIAAETQTSLDPKSLYSAQTWL